MNDVQIYDLQAKLREAEDLVRSARSRVTFTWEENPLYLLELTKLCADAANLLLFVGTTSGKEIDIDACVNYKPPALEDISADDSEQRETNQNEVPPNLGFEGDGNNEGPNDPHPS